MDDSESGLTGRRAFSLFAGLVFAGGIQLIPMPVRLIEAAGSPEAARDAWIVLSLLVLMATWWVTEAIPIPVTALLPLVVLPLTGAASIREASVDYMHPIVVLLLGGFIFAKAIERWNLHTRIALNVVARSGSNPRQVMAGFMIAAAILSMWISNTATAIMMTPIALSVALSVADADKKASSFAPALLCAVAYSCSIGGLGTYIGSPTNLIVKGYVESNTDIVISFVDWMKLGLPVVAVLIPVCWLILTRWAFKVPKKSGAVDVDALKHKLGSLGPISRPEQRVIGVFILIASLWIFQELLTGISFQVPFGAGNIQPFAGLDEYVTAILGVVVCFVIPSGSGARPSEPLLDWKTADSIPWGVILLFGGGMSLAAALTRTGLANWIGIELSAFASLPPVVLLVLITTAVIFATELTSNVAVASALMPVLGAVALASGTDVLYLAMPLAMAASCAFMLPMATGPNAVIYASGNVTMGQMIQAGLKLNLAAIAVLSLLMHLLIPVMK